MGPCYDQVGDLKKRKRHESTLPKPSCPVGEHGKKTASANQEESSSGIESADALISAFPVFRTVRNKCLSFKPTSLQYLIMAA